MRIAIDLGHNVKGDRGATGIKQEDDLIFDVGHKLIRLLENEKHDVFVVAPKEANNVIHSLQQRCMKANQKGCDLFVSLHFNAFNKMAHGSEVYAISTRAQAIGARILTEICKLGFFNRGVKNRGFYVLRHTKMPAVLVECCFCDSARDMERYDAVQMAIAIKNGIVGKKGVYHPMPKVQYLQVKNSTWIKKTTEQSSVLDESQLTLISPGLYPMENREPTEEAHFWVELRSGLKGFVYEDHVATLVK